MTPTIPRRIEQNLAWRKTYHSEYYSNQAPRSPLLCSWWGPKHLTPTENTGISALERSLSAEGSPGVTPLIFFKQL